MNKHLKIWAAAGMMALFMGTAAAAPQAPFSSAAIVASAANEQITVNGVTYELNASAKTAAIVKLDSSKVSFTTSTSVKYNNITYSINEIAGYSCTNMPNLTSLTISSSIKKIGCMAFGNCKKLETVKINGTPTIERDLFYGCSALKNVTLNSAITKLGETMFQDCVSLKSITLPSKLETIGTMAFANCTGLTAITIPSSVRSISVGAFRDCSALSTINLPNGIKTIEKNTFCGCSSLKLPSFPSSLTSIGEGAFSNTSSLSGTLVIPKTITSIGKYAFQGSGLTEVLSQGSTALMEQSFASSPQLKKLTLTGTESVGKKAFLNCSSLSNLIVPISAACNWEYDTFSNCPQLYYLNGTRVSYVYNSTKNDVIFNGTGIDSFIRNHFNGVNNVGFLNSYVNYYCNIVVTRCTNGSMTQVQKAKALHDWVIKKVDFDSQTPSAPKNHTVYSIFLNSTSVCDGYAHGYEKLLNNVGISNTVIGNASHVWNKCKIGGLCFHIDTLWDDGYGDTPPKSKWFLITDKEVLELNYSSHSTALSGESSIYPMGDLNMDKVVNEADIDLMKKYLLGNYSLNSKQAILADLDFDNELDSLDLSLIRKKFNQRFDINGDGSLNNQDHALLQFYIVKQGKKKELYYKSDINNDGELDSVDAAELRSFLEKYCGQPSNAYYRMGDLNRDGKVTDSDLVLLNDHLNGWSLSTVQQQLADLNSDGKVDSSDLTALNNLLKYKFGDVNRDGKVDKTDKDMILKYIVGSTRLRDDVLWYADYNGDGAINNADVVLICKEYNISD